MERGDEGGWEAVDPATDVEISYGLGHIASPCAYLPDRESRLFFLESSLLAEEYRTLLDRGYRRSGSHVYRPDCLGCAECQVIRLPVRRFQASKSQRRILRRGTARFRHQFGPPEYSPEREGIYLKYLQFQHDRAGTGETGEERYRAFFTTTLPQLDTRELTLFDGSRLVGVGIVDVLGDALSSVYFFFDPEYAALSPGTYSMLLEIGWCRQIGLEWYYPGFFIAGCAAMSYKGRVHPAELRRLPGGPWRPIHHEGPEKEGSDP